MTTAALRRNKAARDFKFFETLIKAPGSIGTGFVMPANGRLGISSPAGGVLSVNVGGRVMTTPALAPNQVFQVGWIERGKVISGLTAGGNLLVHNEWMVPSKISSAGAPASEDPATLAWRDAIVGAGGTVGATYLANMDTFVKAEKTAGTWVLTDDYWPMWGENDIQSRMSLKQLRLCTVVGAPAPVHTPLRGVLFASGKYFRSGFIESTHGANMTASKVRMAVYERTDLAATNAYVAGAQQTTVGDTKLNPRRSVPNSFQMAPHANAISGLVEQVSSLGFSVMSRNGAVQLSAYKNGVLVENINAAAVRDALLTIEYFIGCYNNSGSLNGPRATQLGMLIAGGPLDATQELAQYNNVQALATAIGANV